MSPFAGRAAFAATLLGALVSVAITPVATASAAWQSPALVGVVGHWTDVLEGGAAITVDGTKWSGQTSTTDVASSGKRLFGSTVSETLLSNWTAGGAFPLAIAPAVANFTEGTVRVQFKMVGGASDQNAGIVFALNPNGEYLYARYNTKDGDLALWRFTNGERALIVHGTGTSKLALGAWHELVLTVRGRNLTATVTGVPAIQLAHTLDAAPAGKVGVWVKRDAITTFRSFSVQP